MSNRVIKRKRGSRANVPPTHRARIEQALASGDVSGAAALAEAAFAAGHADPMILNLCAWRREEAGDFAGAHAMLKRALALAPGDVMVMGAIGAVLRKEGRLADALAILDTVVAAEPRHAAAWLERGYVLDQQRFDEAAAESYTRALALDPHLAPALGKLADTAAKRGDRAVGTTYAMRAIVLDPLEPAASCALATMAIEAGDAAAAAARLEPLLAGTPKPEDRVRALTLLGEAREKQGRTDEAFATWQQAQRAFAAGHAALLGPGPGRPSHRAFIEAITAQVAAAPPMPSPAPPQAVPGEAATHVFLLGYPRSGTTLVENVLASSAQVVALEERDTLADTDEVLVANDGTMPPLDRLDPALVARMRTGYWQRVAKMGGDVVGKTFVDMNPFNGIKLPVIARLFPRARIVIMRRDPRDVVLSCFRINFTPSPAAYAFSDLEETACHYDALMRLTELCRERLPLAVHEVRYDRLVADFEPTVRALADFIGLPWTNDFRAFDKTAQTRGVRTASVTQVRRGLYDGGGSWRRYERQLAPILPILAPWIERFGFTA